MSSFQWFSVLCLLFLVVLLVAIIFLVLFLFSFLILSHDFHEALFLTTRTYLSCTIHTECVEIQNGKTKRFRLLLACTFCPFVLSIASLSAFLALTLVLVLM
jgi:hypothetical protein